MFDLDLLMQQSASDGWAFLDRVNGELRKASDEVKDKRETTARMWQAIARTEAGRHVLTELAQDIVLKTAFPLPLAATVEQVAMHGVWASAQQELAKTILAMAWGGAAVRSSPSPQTVPETHDVGSSRSKRPSRRKSATATATAACAASGE